MAKILAIDDEPNNRTILDMLLRGKGHNVLFANNGWNGLELYRQEHPDAILLDLRMPGLDGIAVLKEIRSVDLEQPVIIWTGDTNPETERQVRALGVSGFIVKGASLNALTDVLDHVLASPTSRIES